MSIKHSHHNKEKNNARNRLYLLRISITLGVIRILDINEKNNIIPRTILIIVLLYSLLRKFPIPINPKIPNNADNNVLTILSLNKYLSRNIFHSKEQSSRTT
ncbi:hypothetical protein [uncultured Methanosphaera sp.]|uniref:hypothetical protein n=1 Tax=uncultured Methanosphaera sp. TaxID=262501 RepID=UPI0025DD0A3F|nr:hypothetical protein [uncultured Methanosphaera sp.]MDD6285788.1 hypothetical protein [Methanobacteriaceae archaeon]